MQQADFSRLLDLATADAIALAKMMLLDELSDQYVYRIFPNQSFDGNRDAEEIVYPMDSLGSIDDYIMMTRDECISFMYREGRLPEWIDISVGAAGADLTYIAVGVAGDLLTTTSGYIITVPDAGRLGLNRRHFLTGFYLAKRFQNFGLLIPPTELMGVVR